MPICIECRYPLRTLYTTYSKADDRALGKGVRLTQCPRCKRFGDKYVEHDFVVLFIDLVLIKPQVYRHLLFNRLGREDDRFDVSFLSLHLSHNVAQTDTQLRAQPSIIRLGILLLLFDVYLTWARIEKASPSSSSSPLDPSSNPSSLNTSSSSNSPQNQQNQQPPFLSTQPLVLQYMFFLGLCTAQTLAFHLPIRFLCMHPPRLTPSASLPPSGTTTPHTLPSPPHPKYIPLIPHHPFPTPISTALLVSSCTKLFPLLLIIWDYDLPSSASAVSWAVIVNNIAALEILMDCGYLRAGLLVGVAAAVRAVVGSAVLGSVGFAGAWGDGGVGEVVAAGWKGWGGGGGGGGGGVWALLSGV
ncbi:Arv1-like family-domain-containing protein [Phyllosticta capitalensis]|uniref:Protein ARV n=1 Tax=Phyllosticta capitalensis TaxID=121624 RepID=A0ABR1Y9Q3_9PEZI